jgi:nucleoid DNA-binding protein
MKKKELIERIAEESGASKSEAHKYFEAFEEVVTEALKGGEEAQDLRRKPLATALKRMRRERASRREGIVTEMHDGLSTVRETEPLGLTNSLPQERFLP